MEHITNRVDVEKLITALEYCMSGKDCIKHELGYINEVKKKLHEKELEESRSWEHVI